MKLFKSIGVVSISTFVSRITGYIRDMVSAYIFGANHITDAFYLSFTIPNFFRNLLAEGALSVSIIPIYSEELNKNKFQEANKNISVLISFLLALSFVITVLGIIFAPQIIAITAPGFHNKGTFHLAVKLLRIMFPFLLFISISAMMMGILNSLKHFLLPALSQVFFNITEIIFIGILSSFFGKTVEEKIFSAAFGVFAGGILQFAVQIPSLIKKRFNFVFKIDFKSDVLKKGLKLLLPAVFGMSIIQINLIVDSIIGSMLDKGSISYLYYSNRLLQFPLAVFAISIGTVLLPFASDLVCKKEFARLNETIKSSMKIMLLFTLPSIVGFFAIGRDIIKVLFEHGQFKSDDTFRTYLALIVYSSGLISYSCVRIFSTIYYSYHDTKTPVKYAASTLFLNVIIKIIIIYCWTKYFPFKQYRFVGLTLGTAIASTINVSMLYITMKSHFGNIFRFSSIKIESAKLFLSSIIMGIALLYLKHIIHFNKYINLTVLLLAAGVIYFIILKLLKVDFAGMKLRE